MRSFVLTSLLCLLSPSVWAQYYRGLALVYNNTGTNWSFQIQARQGGEWYNWVNVTLAAGTQWPEYGGGMYCSNDGYTYQNLNDSQKDMYRYKPAGCGDWEEWSVVLNDNVTNWCTQFPKYFRTATSGCYSSV